MVHRKTNLLGLYKKVQYKPVGCAADATFWIEESGTHVYDCSTERIRKLQLSIYDFSVLRGPYR